MGLSTDEDEELLISYNIFEARFLDDKFIFIDKFKNILFPGSVDISSKDILNYNRYINKIKFEPTIRIFIKTINGNFKLNFNQVYKIKQNNVKCYINKEDIKELDKNFILPNKIFFLKELHPIIKYTKLYNKYNDLYPKINLIPDLNNKIEKDNLFKDILIKYLFFKNYFIKYTQREYRNLSSIFICLNLSSNYINNNILNSKIVFLHINNKTGLIDNYFEVGIDSLITLFNEGYNQEEILIFIKNLFLIFIKTGKISNLDFNNCKKIKEFKKLDKELKVKNFNFFIESKFNNNYSENLKFYSYIYNNNLSEFLVDNIFNYNIIYELNNIDYNTIFMPEGLMFLDKELGVLLDFQFAIKTALKTFLFFLLSLFKHKLFLSNGRVLI